MAAEWKHPGNASLTLAPLTHTQGALSFEKLRLDSFLHCTLPRMTDTVSLGDRMKQYEAQQQHFLDGSLPAVIRLDGHGFSKYRPMASLPALTQY